jgi:Asp-tRNA(Asn)/Glu-tRNA(Gln) amidotransferase C subunit
MGETNRDEEMVEPESSKDNIVNRILHYARQYSQRYDAQEEKNFCNDLQQILSLIDPVTYANPTKRTPKAHCLTGSNVEAEITQVKIIMNSGKCIHLYHKHASKWPLRMFSQIAKLPSRIRNSTLEFWNKAQCK